MIKNRDNSLRIVFVYIDKFGPLVDEQVNFDSAIRCEFKDNVLRVEKRDPLPDDFWAVGEHETRHKVISNVSAIVGENGTGKTSIARYLAGICSNASRYPRYLIVYKVGGKYFCAYKQYMVRIEGDVKISLRRKSFQRSPFDSDLRFLYLTPHYAMHSVFDGVDDVYTADLSPRGLIEAGARQFYDGRKETERVNPWGVLRYEREEQARIFQLLGDIYSYCSQSELGRLNIPALRGVLFSVSRFGVSAAHAFVGEAYKQTGIDKSLREYRKEQLRVSRDFEEVKSAFARIFMTYALCYWHEHDICGDEQVDGTTFGRSLGKFLSDSLIHGLDGKDLEEAILSFLKEEGPRYDEEGERASKKEENVSNPVYDFFIHLSEIWGMVKRGREDFDLFLPIRSEEEFNDFIALLKSYREVSGVCDFMDFCYYPYLSAGQEALLSMWGRVYDWFLNPCRFKTPKEYQRYDPSLYDSDEMSAGEFFASRACFDDLENVVVFFDEAETSLHPEWQRRFLYDTLLFLQKFGDGYNIQVVLATHSPILLSDIPKGNVHFLFVNGNEGETQRASLQESKNTFAANVYDLYQMSFFLKNGPIGEFAKEKIRGLKSHPDDRIVNLVGDDLLKRLLPREER